MKKKIALFLMTLAIVLAIAMPLCFAETTTETTTNSGEELTEAINDIAAAFAGSLVLVLIHVFRIIFCIPAIVFSIIAIVFAFKLLTKKTGKAKIGSLLIAIGFIISTIAFIASIYLNYYLFIALAYVLLASSILILVGIILLDNKHIVTLVLAILVTLFNVFALIYVLNIVLTSPKDIYVLLSLDSFHMVYPFAVLLIAIFSFVILKKDSKNAIVEKSE